MLALAQAFPYAPVQDPGPAEPNGLVAVAVVFVLCVGMALAIGLIRRSLRRPGKPVSAVVRMDVPKPKPTTLASFESDEFYSKVVGVTFKNDDGSDRQRIIKRCKVGEQLRLVRRPINPIGDENAIAVCRRTGEQVGHLSGELAEELAPEIDDGIRVECFVSDLTGGTREKPTRGVNVRIVRFTPHEHVEHDPLASDKAKCSLLS